VAGTEDSEIDDFITKFYPWAKQELIEAESFSGFYDVELWMNVRNGLDDFLASLYFYKKNQGKTAKQSLDESQVHLRTSVHSAWMRAASIKIRTLQKTLEASKVRGDIESARSKLVEAKISAEQSRNSYSTDYLKAVKLAKQSANLANDGLKQIHEENQNPFYLVIAGATVGGLFGAIVAQPIVVIIGGAVGALIGFTIGLIWFIYYLLIYPLLLR
jgi:hypothetical protein